MIILFYVSGFIAILSTVCVILNKNPIHAVFFLILSFLSVSCNLFSLKAPIPGAIEIIIYAGAIMVLFVFSTMMFDIKNVDLDFNNKEFSFLPCKICFGILLLMSSLLTLLLYSIFEIKFCFIDLFKPMISANQIGIMLFGPYMLVVEMASFLLLSSLISVLYIIQPCKMSSSISLKESQEYKL